jgi:hypothetical protein
VANLRISHIFIVQLILLVTFIPSTAFALAGIAERTSIYHYNHYAELYWAHPGDTCDGNDTYCLSLKKKGNLNFTGLECNFEEINLPKDVLNPIILARRSIDNKWIVYDLRDESYLIDSASFNDAYAVWTSTDNNEVSFIDVKNPDQFLFETKKSIRLKWAMRAFFYFVPCVILTIIFFSLAFMSCRKFRKAKSIARLMLSITYTALCGTFLVFVSIFIWAIH